MKVSIATAVYIVLVGSLLGGCERSVESEGAGKKTSRAASGTAGQGGGAQAAGTHLCALAVAVFAVGCNLTDGTGTGSSVSALRAAPAGGR